MPKTPWKPSKKVVWAARVALTERMTPKMSWTRIVYRALIAADKQRQKEGARG